MYQLSRSEFERQVLEQASVAAPQGQIPGFK
jgi:hypothetical protein